MTRVRVPYHLDDYLPDLDIPAEAEISVTVDLPAGGRWQRMGVLYESVAERVAKTVRGGGRPAVFAGDCPTSLGIMAGLQRAGLDPAIVWFDAHGDLQTMETTTSGYLGGMPLRILTGYRPDLVAASLGLRPVPETRILLAGARDLDPPEVAYLSTSAIRCHPVGEVTAGTVPDGPLYLHVDFDVADPTDLPDLLFPAPDGPRLPELTAALNRVVATGRVVAICLGCTWHPGRAAADPLRVPVAQLLSRWGDATAT